MRAMLQLTFPLTHKVCFLCQLESCIDFKHDHPILILTTCLFLLLFSVGKTEAYPLLVAQRPGGSLMSPVVLFSLISQIIVQTTVQVGGFYYVQSQPW